MTAALLVLVQFILAGAASADEAWPALPEKNGAVEIPAQSWPLDPGPRKVRVLVHYPGGRLANVGPQTGIMLTLHNWGGSDCAGTASPAVLAQRLNVVALCVNYLQSGRELAVDDPRPYDFGWLQALDALRALRFMFNGLEQQERPFHKGRLYATGGSGGGNVTLMAAKLAPRTFACIVDMCGMARLSHDIAFNLPGGSGLNARWSRDPQSPYFLSSDGQELRYVGHPAHLATMRKLGCKTKLIIVHGRDDGTCPFADAEAMVENMRAANLEVTPHFIAREDLDGTIFTSSSHALGNRTEIVFQTAGKYVTPESPQAQVRREKNDFQLRDEKVRYKTSGGEFIVSYKNGYPVGRFAAAASPPNYKDHQSLLYYLDEEGNSRPVRSKEDWEIRRDQILQHMQRVMGRLPAITCRTPLDVKMLSTERKDGILWRKISYQTDPYDRVSAWLLIPKSSGDEKLPAMLCLHQTTKAGKDEPVGLTGNPNMHYALELAQRGFVTLSPDYPSLGEHAYDFDPHRGYSSGTMKAVWDNIRSVDALQSLEVVDRERIGAIGHSLGGHSALFTAAFEPRLSAIVSSCGFTRFGKDDVPSWSGPRYMPRIASEFGNDAKQVPFDFSEIVGALAPRPFLACAAQGDGDFDVTGVKDVIESARPIYKLYDQEDSLQSDYPTGPHDFPKSARQRAYEFLDQKLKRGN